MLLKGNTNRIPTQIEQDTKAIIAKSISTKNSVIVQVDTLLDSQNQEEWTNNILLSIIHNLSFDGSIYSRFGNPDDDIRDAVIESGSGKHSWVKLLGVKMKILLLQLNTLELSDTHKNRILQLDTQFKGAFPKPLQEIVPYSNAL